MEYRTTAGLLVVLALFLVFEEGFCCEANWLRYGDRCFRFYPTRLTCRMARVRCLMEGSDLASISSESILQFIAQHAAYEEGDSFWVGLERDPRTGNMTWLDGTTDAQEQQWVRTPDEREYSDDSLRSGTSCFAYNGAVVTKVSCIESLGMICGRSVGNRQNRTVCNPAVDPLHSFVGEATGNCLFKAPLKTTKDGAEELCRQFGAHFTDLDDMMKDGLSTLYEHQLLANDGSKYWTGLTWNGTDMLWRFGKAVSVDYPISVIRDFGFCIVVQFNFTNILETHFYQTDCGDMASVVCSQKFGESLESEAGPLLNSPDRPQMDSSQLKCPEGYNWKMDSRRNYCYWETSYETEHLSWSEAEAYCQSYGGHLASFHSMDEEKIGLSFQYGNLAHPYWIGLSLNVETETYLWSDGSPLDYTNWAPGHPDHQDKHLRCVAMEAQEKHWVSSLCGILSWFICKVPKQARHYTVIRPTPAPLQPCDKDIGGSKRSYRFSGSCYLAVADSTTWHQAKMHCENEGASLVSIHTADEIGFLLKLLHESSLESNRVWIGLNSFGADGSFQWTDWTPLDFTFFSKRKTDDLPYQEKCYNMYTNNGQWNNENCNAAMSFVCKWTIESVGTLPVLTTADPRIGNCKKGWMPYDDRCYYFGGAREKDRVNWTLAARFCREEGGDLTSIRNDKEQAFLSYMLQSLGVDAWIGFHDRIQTGRYYWLDNSEVRYTNWAVGEPSFFGITEDCVKMVYDNLESGAWKDDDCDRTYGYICQSRRDPDLPKPAYERTTNCLQPEGWLKLEDMCFKMFAGATKTRDEAEKMCQKDGGHLVSVSDQKVKAAVSHLAVQLGEPFFIGLKYETATQRIGWQNDLPVLLTNWEKNEPGFMDADTCFASTSEGYWKKAPCDEPMPYMCQISAAKRTKESRYTGDCPTSSGLWRPGSGSFCYLIEPSNRVDWFTANLMCLRHATHLLSIHSTSEIDDLRQLIDSNSSPGTRSVFIGLMRNKKGGFTWIDDSPVDFVNWDEGEPSNEDEQCVEMMAGSMKWRVTNCIFKRWYVCQDYKDTLVYEDVQSAARYAQDHTQVGLSAGAICAIAVSVIVCLVLLAAAVIYRKRRYQRSAGHAHRRVHGDEGVSFENALYKVNSANMEFQQEDL